MIPLIFIPGMMCDARLFAPQIAQMPDQMPDQTIDVMPISQHDHISALAADILEQAPTQFALAGLSMGGIVAMEILRQAPNRIDKLCLMDTNPLAESEAVKSKREPQIAEVLAGNLAKVMREEMKPNYLTESPKKQDILRLCMDMAMSLGANVFVQQSRALQTRPDQTLTLKAYKGKTLIMHGIDDQLCPADRHALMHQLMPHSTYEIIENAGHLPTLEQPEKVNFHIKNWLNA